MWGELAHLGTNNSTRFQSPVHCLEKVLTAAQPGCEVSSPATTRDAKIKHSTPILWLRIVEAVVDHLAGPHARLLTKHPKESHASSMRVATTGSFV